MTLILTLQITKHQVFTLIDQLSLSEQQEVLQYLVEKTREDLDDTPDDIVIEGIKQGLKEAMVSQLLTISTGVGTIIPTAQDEPLAFIHEVDRRLYLAKQTGRNRIVNASD